jgi:hypothetical protein
MATSARAWSPTPRHFEALTITFLLTMSLLPTTLAKFGCQATLPSISVSCFDRAIAAKPCACISYWQMLPCLRTCLCQIKHVVWGCCKLPFFVHKLLTRWRTLQNSYLCTTDNQLFAFASELCILVFGSVWWWLRWRNRVMYTVPHVLFAKKKY